MGERLLARARAAWPVATGDSQAGLDIESSSGAESETVTLVQRHPAGPYIHEGQAWADCQAAASAELAETRDEIREGICG
jgi:hypothetical protein